MSHIRLNNFQRNVINENQLQQVWGKIVDKIEYFESNNEDAAQWIKGLEDFVKEAMPDGNATKFYKDFQKKLSLAVNNINDLSKDLKAIKKDLNTIKDAL